MIISMAFIHVIIHLIFIEITGARWCTDQYISKTFVKKQFGCYKTFILDAYLNLTKSSSGCGNLRIRISFEFEIRKSYIFVNRFLTEFISKFET